MTKRLDPAIKRLRKRARDLAAGRRPLDQGDIRTKALEILHQKINFFDPTPKYNPSIRNFGRFVITSKDYRDFEERILQPAMRVLAASMKRGS